MYGVYLIGVLVLTGGVIAFIGDRLGTKIGKKRLSIFGLRPRHTSIIITIITGIFITTMTFAVMAAASENVRLALFGMEELQDRMSSLSIQVQGTSAELEAAKKEKSEADAALEAAKTNVDSMKRQQQDLAEESKRLQAGNAELAARNEALVGENMSLAEANAALDAQNGTLLADNAKLSGNNEQLADENGRLESRNQELRDGMLAIREGDITFRAGEIIASGVVRGNRAADEVRADMESLAQLAMRNVSERLGRDVSAQELWIYQPELEAAIQAIAANKQDMVVRVVAAGNLVRGETIRTALELYNNSVIFKADEFIIARPYHITVHNDEVSEQVLRDFLRQVNLAATSKGLLADPINGSVGVIEGMQFYGVVDGLTAARSDYVILSAYAREDTDAQGPLMLNINLEEAAP